MQWVNVTENLVSLGSIAQALLFENDIIRALDQSPLKMLNVINAVMNPVFAYH